MRTPNQADPPSEAVQGKVRSPSIESSMNTHTIAAIATPPGRGGIGIIKISGKDAVSVASSIFRRSGLQPHEKPVLESHRIYHGYIVESGGRVLDEVLLSIMKAPRSYTREDVVEINAHSGRLVLTEILELLFSRGVRPAEPGEFTKRAFLNGRIDLSQAEGIIDVINARTRRALEIAGVQARGLFGHSVQSIRSRLVRIVAQLEAEIDFAEDSPQDWVSDAVSALQGEVIEPISGMLRGYRSARIYRDGVRVSVVGRPNVGKSSLVNRLIREDRVIVTPFPGTTRDLIEEELEIEGIPVILADTAGMHAAIDPVERIGIQKATECLLRSDLVLFMVEADHALSEEDFEIYRLIGQKPAILVINKSDLLPGGQEFFLPKEWSLPRVLTSVLYDRGVDRLKELLLKSLEAEDGGSGEDRYLPNLRQKLSLEKCRNAASAALRGIQERVPEDLVAIDLREALDALGEVTGDSVKESILNEIFSRFCIGK